MPNLAFQNLFHDRIRLSVTLTGVVFALVLILIQFGLFLGFLDTTANIVAHSNADLWISAPGIPHVNGASAIPERRLWQILSHPGVESAGKAIIQFAYWKLPSGAMETVQVVGYDLATGLGAPWNVTAGSLDDLRIQDSVFVDELFLDKLGVPAIGYTTEINGRRARVAGYTRGIRSFTTAPYVYTSFKNAQYYTNTAEEDTNFFLVRAKPGAAPEALKRGLSPLLSNVEVNTTAEMRWRTQYYWLFRTLPFILEV